ncbi:MAG: hypothetical protein BGO07_00070 [Alphaproteobacteria bacterium 40-19]|nr:MAG: hypothetical protein BGO07_00070 [Alphaproteobacteria bacterium 40-19]
MHEVQAMITENKKTQNISPDNNISSRISENFISYLKPFDGSSILENTHNFNDILCGKNNLQACSVAWFLQQCINQLQNTKGHITRIGIKTVVYGTISFKKDIALDIDVYPKNFTFQWGDKENNQEILVKIFSNSTSNSKLSSKNSDDLFKNIAERFAVSEKCISSDTLLESIKINFQSLPLNDQLKFWKEELFKKFTKNSLEKSLTSKLDKAIEEQQSRDALNKLPKKIDLK